MAVAVEAPAERPSLAELKVEELLHEVRVEYPSEEAVASVLSAFRRCFQQIPEHEVNASMAPSFVKDLGVAEDKAKFTFKKPESLEVIGSYVTRTMAMPNQTIDLAVQMPKSCFRIKDFSNHQYHAKRVLYLVELQKWLVENPIVRSATWASMHHDARKPLLLVKLEAVKLGFDFKFDILLVPIIGREVFNISKLTPSRNNLRKIITEVEQEEASPHYNASILEDMSIQAHSLYLQVTISQHNVMKDAILLLKVWLRQKGFLDMPDSFNGFLISMLLAHSVNSGECKITSNMSSFQVFRVCIEMLAGSQFLVKPMFLKSPTSKLDKEGRKVYCQYFHAVILDGMDSCNLAFRVSKAALEEIKEAANGTIEAMMNSRDAGFEEVFMTAGDFSTKFDYHVRISMEYQALKTTTPSFADEDKCRHMEKMVEDILKKGLSDRARIIRVYRRSLSHSLLMKEVVNATRTLPIFVGIKASNFENAYRMVDIGPSADNTEEAAKFRSFWGEKAELRRFKDGTINETAVWESDSRQRHLIIEKIMLHLLQRHLSLSSSDIYIVSGQLDFVTMEGTKDPSASVPKLLQAFDILSKKIRGLEELPLKITSIQPLHAAFRHSAVFPPNINALADEQPKGKLSDEWIASCVDPCDVMIQLEGSGRWPTNLEAVEKMKLAFCLQIADCMQRIHDIKCVASKHSVDLLMHGFCFRLKVYYDKDSTLVQKRKIKADNPIRESTHLPEKGKDFLHILKNDLLLNSLHASMLSGLQGRFPIYGPTVRLAKRWIASHLFSDVLREEAVELLVAYLFLKPAPFTVPFSQITGFLRFLLLLKSYDWANSPLIVDLNGDFTPKELNFILDEFHRVRKNASDEVESFRGQAAMYIATPYDLRSLTWTAMSPNTTIVKRLATYAGASAELLIKLMKGETPEKWPSLFHTPLHLYDIILKVRAGKVPYPLRVLFPQEISAAEKVVVRATDDDFMAWYPATAVRKGNIDVEKQLYIGFDPTHCLIQDLKGKFGDLFNYWYDGIGSTTLAMTWNSNNVSAKKRKRVDEQEEILTEIGRMGEGFIESIHVSA